MINVSLTSIYRIEAVATHLRIYSSLWTQSRNIVELHHEAIDGSGYPYGLKGQEIPIEARICAVADIFDALTSRRPYKPAWSNEKACATLQEMAGTKLDRDCVMALLNNMEKLQEIQTHFSEETGNSGL